MYIYSDFIIKMADFNEQWRLSMIAAGVVEGAAGILGENPKGGRIKWDAAAVESLKMAVKNALNNTFEESLEKDLGWRKGKGKETMKKGWNEVAAEMQRVYGQNFDVHKVKEKYKE